MSNVAYFPGHAPDSADEVREPRTRSPQVEDGYTKLANQLLEDIMAAPLTLREMRVVMAVIRLTYGWNRKQARITTGLLSKLTQLPESIASKTLSSLISKGVVNRHGGSRSPVSLNKNVDQWDVEAPKHVVPSPNSKRSESEQIAKSKSEQIAPPSKDMKDITTADAVVNAQSLRDAFEIFYNAGLPKKDRKRAEDKFKRTAKRLNQEPMQLAEYLADDIAKRIAADQQGIDRLHPTTYLNNERWLDDIEQPASTALPVREGVPACPHAELLAIWNDTCAQYKGKAPNLLDWQGTKSADALAERWAEFYNVEVNGKVRYDSLETGLAWWRMALERIASMPNFRQSDAAIWDLFYKTRFSKAANGNLPTQTGGAVR